MTIAHQYLEKSLDYGQYLQIVKDLFGKGLITGNVQTPGYLDYTKVNLQRYSRLEKTVVLSDGLCSVVDQLRQPLVLLVITEGWCGDAAQNIGIFEALGRYSDKIRVRYIFRDENLELMDQFLTNGSRSIPKVLCLDENLEVKFSWGPRPAALQKQVQEMITAGVSKEDRGQFIHGWYHKDHTLSTQAELEELLRAL